MNPFVLCRLNFIFLEVIILKFELRLFVLAFTYGDGGARSASAHFTRCLLAARGAVPNPGVTNIPPVPVRLLPLLPVVDTGH